MPRNESAALVWADVQRLRESAPLVHNITNYVVMNTTANALLALGAAPVMAHAVEETAEMAALAGALVINIGTLSPAWIDSMFAAGRAARSLGRPIVLDPVGAGATNLRTETARHLLAELRPAIVRGNASEIRALALDERGTRGVDSRHGAGSAVESALDLVTAFDCVVSISGAVDEIVGREGHFRVANGHPMMPRVTGLGCTATALTGAFAAVNASPLLAAAHAMVIMGIAGELAGEDCPGPGSFQVRFLDALYRLDEADIQSCLRLEAL